MTTAEHKEHRDLEATLSVALGIAYIPPPASRRLLLHLLSVWSSLFLSSGPQTL